MDAVNWRELIPTGWREYVCPLARPRDCDDLERPVAITDNSTLKQVTAYTFGDDRWEDWKPPPDDFAPAVNRLLDLHRR